MKVIVVGAGFAGLAAADELWLAGADVEVFEARDRVGGRVWSVPFAGATAERGAEFILPHDTELTELARRLELRLVRKGTLYGNREPARRRAGLGERDRRRRWSSSARCRRYRGKTSMARYRALVAKAGSPTRSPRGWK